MLFDFLISSYFNNRKDKTVSAWLPPRSMTTARVVTPLLRLMPAVPAVYSSGDPLRLPCGGLFNRPVMADRAIQKSEAQVKDQERAVERHQRCAFDQARCARQANP